MARKANVAVSTLDHAEVPAVLSDPEPITKADPPPKAAPRAEPPSARRYRVMGLHQPKTVNYHGTIVTIRPGKEIDDASFDIELLRNVGLQLEEIK